MEKEYKGNQSIDTVLVNQIDAQQTASKTVLDWARLHLSLAESAGVRDTVLTGRVEMRRIDTALHTNPAAAIFGESQVGKSYLVSNLLTDANNNFKVKDPGSADVDFISELNPTGGGAESTSLITRFTVTPSAAPDRSYPIKAKLFSAADIVLIITDSFYSDINNHEFPSREKLQEEVNQIMEKYTGMNAQQSYITAEDIYEMDSYLKSERFPIVKDWLKTLHASGYFKCLATVIANVAPSAWKDVFGILWNNNQILSDIFSRLIRLLRELGFPTTVFINMNSLRNNSGTILSVDRINEFFGVEFNEKGGQIEKATVPTMEVWTTDGVRTVKKSEFTSVTAEIVLEVPEEIASEKMFINNLDILDFPGARTRKNEDEKKISMSLASEMIVRGRVAYLFNKYSRSYLITTLLFCFQNVKSEVNTLASLLGNWVNDMVGSKPEERRESIGNAEIPPLFLIGTKFNLDMVRNNKTEKPDAEESVLRAGAENRWLNRFVKFLPAIVGGNNPNNWFNDWTPGNAFDNTYMLRDYSFSDTSFGGFLETGKETNVKDPEFTKILKESFISYPAVRKHFRNPEEAWQRSATPNEDGAQYIIENLVKASRVAVEQRNRRFEKLVADNLTQTFRAITAFYHDDDASTRIISTMRDAGRLSLIMDTLFSSRPDFFSEFLSALLISEDKLHDKVLDVATEVKLLKDTDITPLLAIRERARIDPSLPDEENIRRLLGAYHLSDLSAVEDYLKSEGFSIDDVLHPSSARNLTQILVEEMEQFWMQCYLNPANLERFRSYGLTDADLEALTGALKALYVDKLHLGKLIISRLRKYITTPDRLDDMADLIADLAAEMFNSFVNSFGAAYFPPELTEEVQATAEKENISLAGGEDSGEYHRCEFNEKKTLDCMTRVFSTFEKVDDVLNNRASGASSLEYFSNYTAFRHWTDNMMRGFLASCDIPKYDIQRNELLRQMLLRAFSAEALKSIIAAHPDMKQSLERMEQAAEPVTAV